MGTLYFTFVLCTLLTVSMGKSRNYGASGPRFSIWNEPELRACLERHGRKAENDMHKIYRFFTESLYDGDMKFRIYNHVTQLSNDGRNPNNQNYFDASAPYHSLRSAQFKSNRSLDDSSVDLNKVE